MVVNVTAHLLSSADVRNEWSYTSTPLICLHGLDRENYFCSTSPRVLLQRSSIFWRGFYR
jgi:hypothetical protein